ncbi:glycosyltransferase family 52 [uncultured Megamonas sp.]|uniref:glycosyltransferase family 52 n=1 Tax=uncultured Megamonas sp. TaxID=286140 RepID=UPI00266F86BA|nr:glycosyltransferase family 52 [uncultured Megamonas sp.]
MKNLFVVNTPYHLLTCFILSHSIFKKDDNYLALMHPHGYEKWKINKLMTYMSTIKCGYKQVFLLLDWLSSKNKKESYRKQANYVKENIKPLNIDKVFIGVDISPVNQLLVMAVGKNQFYRFEDGMYSYFNENRRRKKSHAIFHKIKTYLLKFASNIHGNMFINTEAEGENPAGIADYVYHPKLLRRKSPNTREISISMIQEAIQDLNIKNILPTQFQKNSILYLSQPMVEMGKFTLKEEAHCLKNIINSVDKDAILYYKPHPHDNPEKLSYYKNNFKQLKIYEGIEPAELLFVDNPHLKAVISYQSSALMNVNKFSNNKIKAISLSDIFKTPIYPTYKEIMQQADISFPKKTDEIFN